VSRDYELGTKFRLIVVHLLRKTVEIEVSAFGNFSTDTGSTDCKHKRGVDRQSCTGLIYFLHPLAQSRRLKIKLLLLLLLLTSMITVAYANAARPLYKS